MKLALEVWSSDPDQVSATCRRAEDLGFDGFYYGESPTGLNLDCWTVLAALAMSTDRIRLGPVIANLLPDYRNNALLAKQAATVAALSHGRLDFRTGVGAAARYGRAWWEPFGVHYPGYGRRLDALMAGLVELRRWWSSDPGLGFDHPDIPVTVAATGDRAMALAAADAEGWESSFRTPEEYRELSARFHRLAADVGRTPVGPTMRSLEIDGFVGTTPERVEAVVAAGRQDRGRAEDMDPILARALVGTPEAVAERMVALAEAGVEQLVVALHDPHDPDALQALASARNRSEG